LSSSVNIKSTPAPATQTVIGLDIGSSYVKAVSLNRDNTIAEKFLEKTGYNYESTVSSLLNRFKTKSPIVGVTGYGRYQWEGVVHKTEISALAMGMKHLGIIEGTLVDIGGQDSKILKLEKGKLVDHALNKRCAAGTGSYLEFTAFRMDTDIAGMNRLASQEKETGFHPLNSFCTVFASTEILDCIKKNIPLPKLIRGLYASIAQRIREIAPLTPPVFLSGGVIAHHPALLEVFNTVLGVEINVVPDPQFLAALGIAAYAKNK
jgi:predicted CoA-substrate-specific enzyme activase